jgi:toxin ParE1/3/4
MAHGIVWSPRAAKDLESIADYIAADSPAYAGIVLRNIVNQTRMLARFPRAGRMVLEYDDENLRELIVYNYRVISTTYESEIGIPLARISLRMRALLRRDTTLYKLGMYIRGRKPNCSSSWCCGMTTG